MEGNRPDKSDYVSFCVFLAADRAGRTAGDVNKTWLDVSDYTRNLSDTVLCKHM